MDIAERFVARVRDLIDGRRVILAGVPLAGSTRRIAQLRALGSDRCLVVANGLGTGDLPDPVDADHVIVPTPARDIIDEFRQLERLLADPPAEVRRVIEAFDPDRCALVLTAPYAASAWLGDRPCYGARRPEWVTLEDKTIGDAIFDAAAVRRPPSEVVAARRSALLASAARLDRGQGTVWAGDAREGFNGGGVLVRWIRSDAPGEDVDEATSRFATQCDRVRVAPFVDGVPCSIHGFVCADGVAVLRPVEMVNLRRPRGARFQYAGAATYFDPPAVDRAEMRRAAHRVGRHLSSHHDLRGAFTVDGILGADGWLPTEVNPRFGGGLGYTNVLYPDLPFDLIHHLVVAGDGAEITAADVEALLLPAADDTRWGGGWATVAVPFDRTQTEPVLFDGDLCRSVARGEVADGELVRGPGAEGGFVRLTLYPHRTPSGPSVAPRVAAALALSLIHI